MVSSFACVPRVVALSFARAAPRAVIALASNRRRLCAVANEFRFCRAHRLLRTAEYSEVFGKRRVLRGELLDLHFSPAAAGSARLGLVMPKRNAALAVTRNRCKRIVREIFRERRAELPAFNLVLRLAKSTKAIAREALASVVREDFDKLLRRLPR